MQFFVLGILTLMTPSSFAHPCDAFLMRLERIMEKGAKTYQMMGGLEDVRASGRAKFDLVSAAVPTVSSFSTEAVGPIATRLKARFDGMMASRPNGQQVVDKRVTGIDENGHESITLFAEGDRVMAQVSVAVETEIGTAASQTSVLVEVLGGSWNEYLAGGELRFRMSDSGHRRYLADTRAASNRNLLAVGQNLTNTVRSVAPEASATAEITMLEVSDRSIYLAKGDTLTCELTPVHMRAVISIQLSGP